MDVECFWEVDAILGHPTKGLHFFPGDQPLTASELGMFPNSPKYCWEVSGHHVSAMFTMFYF